MNLRALLLALLLASGFVFPANADCQGEFTPMAGSGSPFTQIHFFPKNGNQFTIAGVSRTIPPGVGVISGSVIGTYNNASIDKVPGKVLAPNTTYFVYVYMAASVMTMDFSLTGHVEDPTYGNEVHAADPSRSLVGMVHTDANGKFVGSANSQMTLSWCNRVRLGVIQMIDNDSTESPTLVEANNAHRIEWLQWSINNTFRQGANSPNIIVTATVANSKVGSFVQLSIAIDGVPCGVVGRRRQDAEEDVGLVTSFNVGSNGTNEGYHYASVLMSTGGAGGKATVMTGAIYAIPLDS
jgi:hypothetical protein